MFAAMEDVSTDQPDTTTDDIRSEQLKRIQQGPMPVELLLDGKPGTTSTDADDGESHGTSSSII